MSRQVDIRAIVSHIVRGDGQDKCRICMGDTTEGQVYLGDTVMVDGERAVTLSELLETITGVEVLPEPDLPSGVCSHCYEDATSAMKFRSLCLSSNHHWRQTINLLSEFPNRNTNQLESIYGVIDEDKIYYVENKVKTESVKKRKKVVQKPCQCPDCDRILPNPNSLYEHLLETTEDKKACYICAAIMSRDDLIDHSKDAHNKTLFGCKDCLGLFQNVIQFKRHVYKAHSPGSIFCGDCGRAFKSEPAYSGHCIKHLAKNCPGCNKLFRNRRCYVHHVKICCNLDKNRQDTHKTKSRVSLEVVTNERKVKVGLRGSADEKSICDYCNKTFAGKKYVKAHIEIVHLKNTHRPCHYCGKSFAAAHMTEHLKKHEQAPKQYPCEHCGIVLNTKLGYIQHLRLHTGEKPYVCKFCPSAFSASSRRSEHVRKMHKRAEDLVLKHACDKCPAKFRLPFRLRKHVQAVHGDKPDGAKQFECQECHIGFGSFRGLLYHTRKHQIILHRNEEDVISMEDDD